MRHSKSYHILFIKISRETPNLTQFHWRNRTMTSKEVNYYISSSFSMLMDKSIWLKEICAQDLVTKKLVIE